MKNNFPAPNNKSADLIAVPLVEKLSNVCYTISPPSPAFLKHSQISLGQRASQTKMVLESQADRVSSFFLPLPLVPLSLPSSFLPSFFFLFLFISFFLKHSYSKAYALAFVVKPNSVVVKEINERGSNRATCLKSFHFCKYCFIPQSPQCSIFTDLTNRFPSLPFFFFFFSFPLEFFYFSLVLFHFSSLLCSI